MNGSAPPLEAGPAGRVHTLTSSHPEFGIGAVARMVNVAPGTLRSWEERYGVVVPHRTANGRRLYSATQVDDLRQIDAMISSGMTAADAHRRLSRMREGGGVSGKDEPRSTLVVATGSGVLRGLLESSFAGSGFDLVSVGSARSALSTWMELDAESAIVDLPLGSDGVELVESLKKARTGYVIVLSSLPLETPADKAGADLFVRKPFNLHRLLADVRALKTVE
jgi:DNA-binding transcriptional MerR regulator